MKSISMVLLLAVCYCVHSSAAGESWPPPPTGTPLAIAVAAVEDVCLVPVDRVRLRRMSAPANGYTDQFAGTISGQKIVVSLAPAKGTLRVTVGELDIRGQERQVSVASYRKAARRVIERRFGKSASGFVCTMEENLGDGLVMFSWAVEAGPEVWTGHAASVVVGPGELPVIYSERHPLEVRRASSVSISKEKAVLLAHQALKSDVPVGVTITLKEAVLILSSAQRADGGPVWHVSFAVSKAKDLESLPLSVILNADTGTKVGDSTR